MSKWMEEVDSVNGGAWRVRLQMDQILFEGRSAFQNTAVFENRAFGRVLALDGIIQTTERDEFFYHEMAVHVPLLAHGEVRKALIIGGGDGGALEEMLKHPTIEAVTMVEIDEQVIAVSKTYLQAICGQAFADPRLELVVSDGVEFLATSPDTYDLILIDSTDPLGLEGDQPTGPAAALFGRDFYRRCKAHLTDGGVLVSQNAIPFIDQSGLSVPLRNLRAAFADVACYRVAVPSFYGGEMAFAWASDNASLSKIQLNTLNARYEQFGIETRYYTPEVHIGAFALPGYLAALVG